MSGSDRSFAGYLVGGLALWVSALLLLEGAVSAAPLGTVAGQPSAQVQDFLGQSPLAFVPHPGQKAGEVQFSAWGGGQHLALTRQGVAVTLPREGRAGLAIAGSQPRSFDSVWLTPVGMRPDVELLPLAPQAGKFNYLVGNDPQKWRTNVPTYQAVLYRQVYPGIDLKFYGNGRQLEYDVIVRPGADPGRVQFRYAGARKLAVSPEGDLVVTLPGGGELRQRRPLVYQEIDGRRVERQGSFKLARQGDAYGFALGGYDPRYPLVIDPVLVFSTYFGNLGPDSLRHIAVDDAGSVYIVGDTQDSTFPVTPHSLPIPAFGTRKVFLAKFTADGRRVYSTLMGGSNYEFGYGLAVNKTGEAYVAGYTYSSDFPVTGGAYRTIFNVNEAFVAKLNSSGSGLIYATFLGGSNGTQAMAMALNQNGEAYVTGRTISTVFPVTAHALQTSSAGGFDVFIVHLNELGSNVLYSSYLGGTGDDVGQAIAVDPSGNIYVTGNSISDDFPLQKAFQTTNGGGKDAFIACVASTGGLSWSTYLGGAGDDEGRGITYGSTGVVVTGHTKSSDFPTAKAIINTLGGTTDAFVTKVVLGKLGLTKAYSTYLGGSAVDYGQDIAMDDQECVYVTGFTQSGNFPSRNSLFPFSKGSSYEVFVTKIDAKGSEWLFSTFLGGSENDVGSAIALDRYKNIYVAGTTTSSNFPTLKAWKGTYTGGGNEIVFLSKIRQAGGLDSINLLLLLD